MSETDDIWHTRANIYWEKFNLAFGSMKLDYDQDDSGTISGEEEQFGLGSLTVGRS